ncbi:FMN-binding negative transcriptional regulator [Cohnella pontilimi]|uniref:FMN-binding negative transcriptional regulator n=1 Tax=Cohnella pontilimi TaxID=2564100 RepID=A0A4U0FFV5_9BACL|nr:FMN-binding negative transcriptional regulator [Cohnella pontilimi]TJY43866.1 FMN-binding negative transcriptional regulator [Cohnella pontilimi]
MYIPKHFAVHDKEKIFEFVEKNSFCILFSNHNGSPEATHLPVVLDRDAGDLSGHFAKQNTQWTDIEEQEVLLVFQGPHSYISSSWYETNLSVPTWNYVAVHVYGTIELIKDKQEFLQTLKELVAKYEDANSPYHLDDTNEEYIQNMMNGIVGFKLKISKMEGKWKLSQNHSRERQQRVIDQLKQLPHDHAQQIARLMQQNLRGEQI